MTDKTKKIIFDSIAIGLSVLLLILFSVKYLDGASFYQYLSLGVIPFEPENPETILYLLFTLSMLMMMIFLPILLALNIVILLCDLDIIKVNKLTRALKITATTIVSLFFVFDFFFTVSSIALAIYSSSSINYALIAFVLIFTIVLLSMIVRSKKVDVLIARNNHDKTQAVEQKADGKTVDNQVKEVVDNKVEENLEKQEDNSKVANTEDKW